MNFKRLLLGGVNVVFGLLAILFAWSLALDSFLTVTLTGLSDATPVAGLARVGALVLVVAGVGLALSFLLPMVGWFTARVSRRTIYRTSLVGLGAALGNLLGALLLVTGLNETLAEGVFLGALLSFPALALLANVLAIRASTPDLIETGVGADESANPAPRKGNLG